VHFSGPAGGLPSGPPDGKVVSQGWARADGMELAYIQNGKLVVTPGGGELSAFASSSYSYLDSLPSSPAKLKAIIERGLKADNYVIGGGNPGVFNAIQALMENMVLPLRLRAALYAVLASDPAVHFDPRVADLAGRVGAGFYSVQQGQKDEIIINRTTYAYMGDVDIATKASGKLYNSEDPSGGSIHISKGELLDDEAVLQAGIVQHAGQVP
jgi:hypothetical protein